MLDLLKPFYSRQKYVFGACLSTRIFLRRSEGALHPLFYMPCTYIHTYTIKMYRQFLPELFRSGMYQLTH